MKRAFCFIAVLFLAGTFIVSCKKSSIDRLTQGQVCDTSSTGSPNSTAVCFMVREMLVNFS